MSVTLKLEEELETEILFWLEKHGEGYMDEYDVGDVAILTGRFAKDNFYTDPTDITFKSKDPSGTVTTYTFGVDPELVRDDVGIYHINISLDAAGEWRFRWQGTAPAEAAEEAILYVREQTVE